MSSTIWTLTNLRRIDSWITKDLKRIFGLKSLNKLSVCLLLIFQEKIKQSFLLRMFIKIYDYRIDYIIRFVAHFYSIWSKDLRTLYNNNNFLFNYNINNFLFNYNINNFLFNYISISYLTISYWIILIITVHSANFAVFRYALWNVSIFALLIVNWEKIKKYWWKIYFAMI